MMMDLRRRALIGKQPLYLIKNGQVVNEVISGGFGAYPYRAYFHETETGRRPDVTYSESYIQLVEGLTTGRNGVFSTNNSIDIQGYSKIYARVYSSVKSGTYNQLALGFAESLIDLFAFDEPWPSSGLITHGNNASYPTEFDGIYTMNIPIHGHKVYLLFYLGTRLNENLHKIYDLWFE